MRTSAESGRCSALPTSRKQLEQKLHEEHAPRLVIAEKRRWHMERAIGEDDGITISATSWGADVAPEIAVHPARPEDRRRDQELNGQSTKPRLKISGRHLLKVEVEAHQQRKTARHNDENGVHQEEEHRLDGYAF